MNVIIVSHSWTHGVQHELSDYLNRRKESCVSLIEHPLPDSRQALPSVCELFFDGNLYERRVISRIKTPEFISYFQDPFYSLYYISSLSGSFDLFIGADSLNAATGILFRVFGKVKKVVYYSHSLQEKRFSNWIANRLYHWLDRFCIRHSDWVWNLSTRLKKRRLEQGVPSEQNLWVPVGVNFNRIKRMATDEMDIRHLVFSGLLTKKNGVQLTLEAFPAILSEVPGATLTIIGAGELGASLRQEVKDKGMEDSIRFTGLMDHDELMCFLPKCGIGLAPYMPMPDSMVLSTDPTKVKEYMACGLPVIMTDVAESAEEIKKEEAGIIIDYNAEQLKHAVLSMIKDRNSYLLYRANAVQLAKKYTWDTIFARTFKLMKIH